MSTKKRHVAPLSDSPDPVEHLPVKKRKTAAEAIKIEEPDSENTEGNSKGAVSQDRVALSDISNDVVAPSNAHADSLPNEKVKEPGAALAGSSSEPAPAETAGSRKNSFEQVKLQLYWVSGHVSLDCTMGMSGSLRSLHGCRSIEAAQEAVKEWPDKKQIRGCPVFVIKQDPATSVISEELVGFVVPTRGGKRPSGGKLDVIPVEERAAMAASWSALVERDRM